jgi:hypothetical protein
MGRCKSVGCLKQAQSKGLCISHGAVHPRCSTPGCLKQAQSKDVCVSHGAVVPRCKSPGCLNQVQSKGVCVQHGAVVPRCSTPGCLKGSVKNGVCIVHKPGYVPSVTYRGEDSIRNFLESVGQSFNEQASFAGCRGTNSKRLRYDFSIVKDKRIIGLVEFNGQQHYRPVTFGGISWKRAVVNYEQQRVHDYIKCLYARAEGLPLLVIRYNQIKFVPEMLTEFLAAID